MKLPEYVSKAEVKRVCKALGLRDWAALKTPTVAKKEASRILKIVNTEGMKIPVEEFKAGLEVELEHGTRYQDANVTNNHPVLTGMIVLAHLKEAMDYYERLEVVEIEGDLLKAAKGHDTRKMESKYRKLATAQAVLWKAVERELG